ncbi:MAG: hypothetical protein HY259_15595 [Chloroflexi bacterium]|nr:hypothetical protein [Chloroflexota bacterium]MBI3734862.1 hypothetical protein [Chloroflexota bacterium]
MIIESTAGLRSRQRTETAIEEVLGGKATSQQALDKAAEDVTKLITDYNKSVK